MEYNKTIQHSSTVPQYGITVVSYSVIVQYLVQHSTAVWHYSTRYSTVQYIQYIITAHKFDVVQSYSTDIKVHYSTVQFSTVQYSSVQYSTVQYSAVQ